MDSTRISYLFQQYEQDKITVAEKEELYALLRSFENNDEILTWLENSYQNTLPQPIETERWRPVLESILERGRNGREGFAKNATIVPLYKKKAFRWIAAASIIIVISSLFLVISKRSEKSPATEVAKTNDVPAPTNTRAVITLAEGSKVYLDSAGNGTIAQEDNVAVIKNANGEIEYQGQKSDVGGPIAYNTLSNPRGSKVISLTLSDGTKVWLNSESSLKYPIAFNANTREVEITGEAYFEVKHNSKQPFKVHLPNGSIVEDLGTAFNINSYSDENNIKTTLIEGSLRVVGDAALNTNNGKVLKPGEQAIINQANPKITRIEVQTNVNMDEVLAWKNGLFSFENADIESVMKNIARWYDVEVVYESRPTKIFRGSIPRDMSAAKVFKALEETGGVHFRIEGKRVIVMK